MTYTVADVLPVQRGCPPVSWSCVAQDDDWRYLLLRAFNHWDFPKGMVEDGEEPLAAAMREVREESTIDDLEFAWGDALDADRARTAAARSRAITWRDTQRADVTLPFNPLIGRPEHNEYRWVDYDDGDRTGVAARETGRALGGAATRDGRAGAARLRTGSDDAAAMAAAQEVGDVGGHFIETALPRLARRPRDVRRDDEVGNVRARAADCRPRAVPAAARRCAAPPSRRRAQRRRRAPAESTSAPRAVLISIASGFMRSSCAAPIMPCVAGVSGQCRLSTSTCGSSSSRSMRPGRALAARTIRDPALPCRAPGGRVRNALAERAVADQAERASQPIRESGSRAGRTGRRAATHRSATSRVVVAQVLGEQQHHRRARAARPTPCSSPAGCRRAMPRSRAASRSTLLVPVAARHDQLEACGVRAIASRLMRSLLSSTTCRAGDRLGHGVLRPCGPQRRTWAATRCSADGIEVAIETDGGVVEKNGAHRRLADSDGRKRSIRACVGRQKKQIRPPDPPGTRLRRRPCGRRRQLRSSFATARRARTASTNCGCAARSVINMERPGAAMGRRRGDVPDWLPMRHVHWLPLAYEVTARFMRSTARPLEHLPGAARLP